MNDTIARSICATVADYRAGEIPKRTPQDLERWVRQYPKNVQEPVLAELDHVLGQTYISRSTVSGFLENLVTNKKLVGDDPQRFWKGVGLLRIQQGGNSQKDMLKLFEQSLKKTSGLSTPAGTATAGTFLYLDDAIFSGNRVLRDLKQWIDSGAPSKAEVHVVVMALHVGGQYYAQTRLEKAAQEKGKNIIFHWWRSVEFEDRKAMISQSDVLRPKAIPDDESVKTYVKMLEDAGYPPALRTLDSQGTNKVFSSPEARSLLEEQFLIAGIKIREQCPYLPETARPLGYMVLKTLGFGSMLVTYRNCPNNCPLAFWVGDPWFPLFPRKTN